jgi:hypothetical protein
VTVVAAEAAYTCSECKKIRASDANRWWLVFTVPSINGFSLVVRPWDRQGAREADEHACGEACATKMFSRFLSTGRLTE